LAVVYVAVADDDDDGDYINEFGYDAVQSGIIL
jgi:hypothetical protein